MVATTSELASLVDDFVERLQRVIRVDMVVLFGSYATQEARDDSDIDLAVFSEDFDGRSTWERQETIARATVGRAYRVSPVGFSMNEYRNHTRHSFVSEVLRSGASRLVFPRRLR
jgi:predicted nucleotidyltransferase